MFVTVVERKPITFFILNHLVAQLLLKICEALGPISSIENKAGGGGNY